MADQNRNEALIHPRALTRPLTVLAATALALVGWGIIGPLLGVDLAVRAAPGGGVHQVVPAAVAIVAVLAWPGGPCSRSWSA